MLWIVWKMAKGLDLEKNSYWISKAHLANPTPRTLTATVTPFVFNKFEEEREFL